MRRARPGIGPEPVPRRTSFVPFALLSAAFARAAEGSMSSGCANVAPAAANVGAATIPVSKLRRETKGVAFCIVASSFRLIGPVDGVEPREGTGARMDYLCHGSSPQFARSLRPGMLLCGSKPHAPKHTVAANYATQMLGTATFWNSCG